MVWTGNKLVQMMNRKEKWKSYRDQLEAESRYWKEENTLLKKQIEIDDIIIHLMKEVLDA